MLRAALTALVTLTAAPAVALCGGESYFDRLTAPERAQIDSAVAATPYAEGLTWTLTRGSDTLTLVGTMHIYDARLAPLHDAIAPTLAEADLLLVETTPAEEAEMQEAFLADPGLYLIQDGPTLPDLLPADVWEDVQAAAAERGMPAFVISQFQPWYLSLTLGIPSCAMSELAQGQRGLDHMLMTTADQGGVPVQALEGWETLISVLASDPLEEQLDVLKMGLLPAEDQSAMFVAMLDSYFSEQIAAVWEVSQVAAAALSDMSEAETAALMEDTKTVLLTDRNQKWMPVIAEAVAAHDNIVVAVGAAHLPGKDGMLDLLEADGWAITRITR